MQITNFMNIEKCSDNEIQPLPGRDVERI